MKTKLLSLFAALLLAQALMAQFHIGAKAGANIIKIDGKSFKDQFRYGYHVGGFMEIGLSKNISLNPEVLFSQINTTLDSNFKHVYQNVFNPNYTDHVRLSYLSIPLVLNMKLIGPVSIQAGPQFSILLDKNKTLLQNGANAFKNGDFSVLGGAQVKLRALSGFANTSRRTDFPAWCWGFPAASIPRCARRWRWTLWART
ncbi:MAG TPA: porin family protein, partial [Chitinophagaceae bacterium]|nr:porin family protein [Chitinophagaceae bacterium]